MRQRPRHLVELRQPVAAVVALGIVVFRLLEDVETVDAAACEAGGSHPVTCVREWGHASHAT